MAGQAVFSQCEQQLFGLKEQGKTFIFVHVVSYPILILCEDYHIYSVRLNFKVHKNWMTCSEFPPICLHVHVYDASQLIIGRKVHVHSTFLVPQLIGISS